MTKELTSYIQQTLDNRTLWEQLAEEGTELSKAALKFIRAAGYSNNPTPISVAQAFADVKEELQDVLHVCSILGLIDNNMANNKPKLVHSGCSEACYSWICCQDCERKSWCENHCKNAFQKNLCEYYDSLDKEVD